MDHVIYTAMGGARHALENQAIVSNNIANVSTAGFKAQLSAMRAVPINGDTAATRTLVVASTPGADMSPGPLNYTGKQTDVSLNDKHFLAVELADGAEAYTRNGNIQISSEGELMIGERRLQGDGGPINVPPNADLTIGADGTITALLATDPPTMLGQIGRLKVVEAQPQDLIRGEDGLFHLSAQAQATNGNVLPQSERGIVTAGVIEGSNVNAAEAMVSMIANARHFEMQMKVVRSADENAQRANQLLAVS
ncbi:MULTISPECIES: flagellar basal body rod protein FlgF [Providencia]|uniref:Flagellar basal-body rod protein FlgF n=1 Tax=Providencia heimbachae ATCC 35613 TaxID=1354272 RepID=A0A1B7K047_9GAMM|nr:MULTISPECIES: flagellar basal body rod protein FlgF [Providencia]MBP6124056.1 flagellar basal body rod protein FlgF [Providencia sp.]NIH23191.1 flagellar basal body rod protein FlgF [Providencia heimbachae]OAT53532.1 FlgF family flagellar basal-body rod protein [Providencia heimbachae ATCC 35613]QCJ70704.1 flagellar basal body rod protein FlgF [Providencia heimbachae]SQH13840.1 Putative proximal rod protein [Providencia heimbachae]